eukprot:2423105-Rhodomonas_salina.1
MPLQPLSRCAIHHCERAVHVESLRLYHRDARHNTQVHARHFVVGPVTRCLIHKQLGAHHVGVPLCDPGVAPRAITLCEVQHGVRWAVVLGDAMQHHHAVLQLADLGEGVHEPWQVRDKDRVTVHGQQRCVWRVAADQPVDGDHRITHAAQQHCRFERDFDHVRVHWCDRTGHDRLCLEHRGCHAQRVGCVVRGVHLAGREGNAAAGRDLDHHRPVLLELRVHQIEHHRDVGAARDLL